MSDRADRRRRSNIRQYSAEDQALNQISKEAETRLQAKRAARAEAREIRLKEIEKQQKEADEKHNRVHELITDHGKSRLSSSRRNSNDSNDSVESNRERDRDIKAELRELEEKYRQAMMTSATLDNEKQTLIYQLELLKDQIEEIEESYVELQREHKDRCRELEMKKRSYTELESEVKVLREHMVLKDKLIEESGFVIMSTESGEYKLEKNSSMSNGPVATTGSVMLSSESIEILKEAGDGSLGTANQHHLRSSPVHETKPCSDGQEDSTEPQSPEGQGSNKPLGKDDVDGETVGDKCEEDQQGGSDSVLGSTKGLGNENGSETGPSALGNVTDGSGTDVDSGEGGIVPSVQEEHEMKLGGDESHMNDQVEDATKQNNEDGGDGVGVLGSGSQTELETKPQLSGVESKLGGVESNMKPNDEFEEVSEQNNKDGDKVDSVSSSEESLSETRGSVPILDLELQSSSDTMPRDDSGIFSPDDVVSPHTGFSGQVEVIEPDTDEEGDEFFDAVSTPSPFAVNKDKTNYEFKEGEVNLQPGARKETEGHDVSEEAPCDSETVDDEFVDRVCHSGDKLDNRDIGVQDKLEDSIEEVEGDNLRQEKCVNLEGEDGLHEGECGIEKSNYVESEEQDKTADIEQLENCVAEDKDEGNDPPNVEAKEADDGPTGMEEDLVKAEDTVPLEKDKGVEKGQGNDQERVEKNAKAETNGQLDLEKEEGSVDLKVDGGVAKEQFAIKADTNVKNDDNKDDKESHFESPDTEEEELEDFCTDEDEPGGEVIETEKKEKYQNLETEVCPEEHLQGSVQGDEDDGNKLQEGLEKENVDKSHPECIHEGGVGEGKNDDKEDKTEDDDFTDVKEQLSEGSQGFSDDISYGAGSKVTEEDKDEQTDNPVASNHSCTELNAEKTGAGVTVTLVTEDQCVNVGVEDIEILATQEEEPVASKQSGTEMDAEEGVNVVTEDQSLELEGDVSVSMKQEENQPDKVQDDDGEVKKLHCSDQDDEDVMKGEMSPSPLNDVAKEPSKETVDVIIAVQSEGSEESAETCVTDGKEESTIERTLPVEIEKQEVNDDDITVANADAVAVAVADATTPKDAGKSDGSQDSEESGISPHKKDVMIETGKPEDGEETKDVHETEPGEGVVPGEKVSSNEAVSETKQTEGGACDSSQVAGKGSSERMSTDNTSDDGESKKDSNLNQDSAKPDSDIAVFPEENTEDAKVAGSGQRVHVEEEVKEQAESKQKEPEQEQKDYVLKRPEYSGDSDDEVFIKEESPAKVEEKKDVDSPIPSVSSSEVKSESRMRSDGELSEDDLLNDAYSFDDIDEVLEDPEEPVASSDGSKNEKDTAASESLETKVQIVIDKAEDLKEGDQSEGKGETVGIGSFAKASSSDSISVGSGDLVVSDDPGSTSSGAEGVSIMSAPPSPKEGKKGKKFGKFFKSIFK
ncbi:dentin sialophosphoprotein-like [Haliotis asinina]|uniref:dentin sialophosphoprotein-like n=1 Tax=Haliotis asinina TaxID=109174 RepID=UPI0035321474